MLQYNKTGLFLHVDEISCPSHMPILAFLMMNWAFALRDCSKNLLDCLPWESSYWNNLFANGIFNGKFLDVTHDPNLNLPKFIV